MGIVASNIGTEASNIVTYHFQPVCSIYLIPLSGRSPLCVEARSYCSHLFASFMESSYSGICFLNTTGCFSPLLCYVGGLTWLILSWAVLTEIYLKTNLRQSWNLYFSKKYTQSLCFVSHIRVFMLLFHDFPIIPWGQAWLFWCLFLHLLLDSSASVGLCFHFNFCCFHWMCINGMGHTLFLYVVLYYNVFPIVVRFPNRHKTPDLKKKLLLIRAWPFLCGCIVFMQ